MLKPIKRIFRPGRQMPGIILNTVDLLVAEGAGRPGSANCEVTEYDNDADWKQWEDSVFTQAIEELVDTIPAPLAALP